MYEACSGGKQKAVQGDLTSKDNEYTPEKRAKMGRYGAEKGPAKTARHFSQLVDSKIL